MTPAADGPWMTRTRLAGDLRRLGLAPGQTVMLHASVRRVGWVVGGPDVVIRAVLDVIGPAGTLMMMVGWEESPYHLDQWPAERRTAYLRECPPFDPATSRACRKWSILTEYLRTWPGAHRSIHPEGSCAAVGKLASWLTRDHPLQYGYGPGSPFGKLYDIGGHVLLLGSDLSNVTMLHYAEHVADVAAKRLVRYRMPLLVEGRRTWVDMTEYDTSICIADWPGRDGVTDYFEAIMRDFIKGGGTKQGDVGAAPSHLCEARGLVDFGKGWMEREFGRLP